MNGKHSLDSINFAIQQLKEIRSQMIPGVNLDGTGMIKITDAKIHELENMLETKPQIKEVEYGC